MQFTPEQREAITAMRPLVCVAAGAGSGKTSILVERIAHLLEQPGHWPDGQAELERIAAITFTDKAAAEMKARLRAKFRAKPAQDDPQAMRFWREMERQVENARITTIHAFCAGILREHALRIGMDPEWSVPGEAESAQLAEKVVVETLQHLLEMEEPAALRLSLHLNRNEIKQALLQAITLRAWFEEEQQPEAYADPDALMRFWEERLPALHASFLREMHCAPELSRLYKGLRASDGCCENPEDKLELRRRAYLELLDDLRARKPGMWPRIVAVIAEHSGARASKAWLPEAKDAVRSALQEAKDFFEKQCAPPTLSPEFDQLAAELSCDFHTVARAVVDAAARARRERVLMDFEDMIDMALRLLRDDDALRRRIAGGMRFLLIDEFQDTDARQLEIASLLCNCEEGPDLFIVGDAKQSIYYFRGAEVRLFRDMLARDKQHILLADNFRSLPDVLNFVNDFFARSGLLDAVERYQPMNSGRAAANTPRVEIFAPEDAAPDAADADPVRREQDAHFVARRIRALCDPENALTLSGRDGTTRPATYDDIVLLFRRGGYMHEYESALREAGVPFNRVAGAGFFQRREILDMIALLNLAQDPWDEDALLTVLRSPLACLSDESLLRMARWADGLAAAFHSDDAPEDLTQRDALEAARALFRFVYAGRDLPPGTLLRRVLEYTCHEAVLLSQHLGLQRVSNLRKMARMADEFGRAQAASPAEFAHYLQEVSVQDIREGEAPLQARGLGAVTLMTIHKAKGLEFPIVFLPEMFVGMRGGRQTPLAWHPELGPAIKAPDADGSLTSGAAGKMIALLRRQAEMAEMARVLYVAMTRACDYLVLCGHANPRKLSWAEALNQTFDLDTRQDGDLVEGSGWQAALKRELPPEPPRYAAAEAQAAPDPATIAAAIAPAATRRKPREVVSVSRLLALMCGDSEETPDIEHPSRDTRPLDEQEAAETRARSFAMARGELVHRMFELWDFHADTPPHLDALAQTARLGLVHHQTMKAQLERMIARLRASDYWPCFTQATNVLREVPFLLDIGPVLVRGVIDLVLDERIILDYKTGKPNPTMKHRYETQLRLYAAAARTLCGVAPEKGMLWYADHGVMHEIAFTEAAIEDTLRNARNCVAPD